MELVDDENKFWIHKVEFNLIEDIDKEKYVGSKFLSSLPRQARQLLRQR